MEALKLKARRWGNSFGILIPKNVVRDRKIRGGELLEVIIAKRGSNVLKKTFGTLKFSKSAQEIKNELRRELYNE